MADWKIPLFKIYWDVEDVARANILAAKAESSAGEILSGFKDRPTDFASYHQY